MSTILEQKLNLILNEKQTKILPENLKKGVSYFDVEGTAETGNEIHNQDKTITENGIYTADEGYTGLGTVTAKFAGGDTKTFETVEDMKADTDPIPDGKALIYRKVKSYIKSGSKFYDIWYPKTITLPEAITSDITVRCETYSEHGGGGGNVIISKTGFNMHWNANMSMASISYTSEDGITYTRTSANVENETTDFDYFEFNDDVLTLNPGTSNSEGYYMTYKLISGNETLVKEFFARMSYGYYGLYINKGTANKDLVLWNTNIRLEAEGTDYTKWSIKYDKGTTEKIADKLQTVIDLVKTKYDLYHDLIEKVSEDTYRVYMYKSKSTSSYSQAYFAVLKGYDTEDNNMYIGGIGTDVTVTICEVNTANNTITDITNNYTFKNYTLDSENRYARLITTPINRFNSFTYLGVYQRNIDIQVLYISKTTITTYYNWNIDCQPGKSYSYQTAQTQFTLEKANQLLPDMVALGKDGVVEGDGSIYTSISFRKFMSERNQDINEISAVYSNQTTIDYKSLLITNDRTGLVENNTAYYAKSKKIPSIPGYNIVFVTSKYFIYQSTVDYSLTVYDRISNTKLYDVTDMTYIPITAKYNYVKDLGDDVYFITSASNEYKNRLFHFTATNCNMTILNETTNDYICACYMLEDKAFYIEIDYTNKKLVAKKIVYSTGIVTTLTTVTPTNTNYIGSVYGNSEKDNTYIYLSANFLNTSQSYVVLVKLSDETVSSTKYTQHMTFARHIDTNTLLAWQGSTINSINGTTITKIADVTSTYNDYVMSAMYVPTIGMMSFQDFNGPMATIGTRDYLDMAYIFGANSGNAGHSIMTKSELKNGKLVYTGTLTMDNVQYITEVYIDTLIQYNENVSNKNNLLNIGDNKTNYICLLNTPESSGPITQTEYNTAVNTADKILGGNSLTYR